MKQFCCPFTPFSHVPALVLIALFCLETQPLPSKTPPLSSNASSEEQSPITLRAQGQAKGSQTGEKEACKRQRAASPNLKRRQGSEQLPHLELVLTCRLPSPSPRSRLSLWHHLFIVMDC